MACNNTSTIAMTGEASADHGENLTSSIHFQVNCMQAAHFLEANNQPNQTIDGSI